MICAGIPVLRPLYRRITGALSTSSKSASSTGYYKHDTGNDAQSVNINLQDISSKKGGGVTSGGANNHFPDAHPKLGIRGATTVTYIKGDNHSDEEILGWEYRRGQGEGGIQVREHVDVRVEGAERKGSRNRGGQSQRDGASVEEMV
jgi:hypothetical protein